MTAFVDANIILRHLATDHPDHSPRATAFLAEVESGERRVQLAHVTLFEIVFTLEKFYRQSKEEVRDLLMPILTLPGVTLTDRGGMSDAFNLYTSLNISLPDAYLAVLATAAGNGEIISFDRDFDRIPGIQRIEPGWA